MDIKAYIETGILESYALGHCSKEEAAEVEAMCVQFPELKEELTAVQSSIESYARFHAKAPAAKVKNNIMAAIEETVSTEKTPEKVYPELTILYTRLRRFTIAAIALFVLSFAFNLILYKRWSNSVQELTALNAEKVRLAEDLSINKASLEQVNQQMAMTTAPATLKIVLKGMDKSPGSMAMVYWNKETKSVMLQVENLPMPADGKQYQLWAIVDGKPVDAGMIAMETNDSSLHAMKAFESAQAFAITLENTGGSPSPDMSALYVMGSVSL